MLEVQGAGGFAWAALAEGSVETRGAGAKRGNVGVHVLCSVRLVIRLGTRRKIVIGKQRSIRIEGSWGILQRNVRERKRQGGAQGIVKFVERGDIHWLVVRRLFSELWRAVGEGK